MTTTLVIFQLSLIVECFIMESRYCFLILFKTTLQHVSVVTYLQRF